jgi:hypothetical protein
VVLSMALVMAAMMLAMALPAFGQPGGSEHSCGASNPNIGVPAGPPETKAEEFFDELCGFRNNPHESGIPPGQEN